MKPTGWHCKKCDTHEPQQGALWYECDCKPKRTKTVDDMLKEIGELPIHMYSVEEIYELTKEIE